VGDQRYQHSVMELSPDVEFSKENQIADVLRAQIDSHYVPTRLRAIGAHPNHVLKSSQAIPQLPVLNPTEQACEEHEVFHEGQNVEDFNCPFCRETIRDRITSETRNKKTEPVEVAPVAVRSPKPRNSVTMTPHSKHWKLYYSCPECASKPEWRIRFAHKLERK
jgi:hypothetical protein